MHRYLRKETIESTKATNTRWGRWEDILLDPDLEIGPAQPPSRVDRGKKQLCGMLKPIHPDGPMGRTRARETTYTKMWEYPEGTRVSTAHLSDGQFVALGPLLPPLMTATEGMSETPKRSTTDAAIQTEWMTWSWADRLGELSEIDPMNLECATANATIKAGPGVIQRAFGSPVMPTLSPPTPPDRNPLPSLTTVEDDVLAMALAVEQRMGIDSAVTRDESSTTPSADKETPCMDEMLLVDQWDASPEAPHLSPMIPTPAELDVLTIHESYDDDDLLISESYVKAYG